MSVDQATVRRVAKLARIKVKEENVERLAGELNSILHWIEQISDFLQINFHIRHLHCELQRGIRLRDRCANTIQVAIR